MKNREWIDKINKFVDNKIPFLTILNFDKSLNLVYKLNKIPKDIEVSLPIFSNQKEFNQITEKIKFKTKPISLNKYSKHFVDVITKIKKGDSYLLNLCCKTEIETNLTLSDIFRVSKAPYKLLFKNKFTVYSPELFIEIYNNKIYTYPMKGTIDSSYRNAKEILRDDEKEISEHYTIVDLLRNDLSIVAKNVKVDKFRYFEKIKTNNKSLYQTSSKISGDLAENYKLGDILNKMLPAGSITGAPKSKTIEIINEVEDDKRGYYTGIFGVFDGKKFQSAVMIRFVENINGKMYYRSGGGITYLSNCEDEYNELINKIYVPIS